MLWLITRFSALSLWHLLVYALCYKTENRPVFKTELMCTVVCRLPLCINFHVVFCLQVHYILQEVVMGGMVLETNMNEITTQVDVQNRMEKSEVSDV